MTTSLLPNSRKRKQARIPSLKYVHLKSQSVQIPKVPPNIPSARDPIHSVDCELMWCARRYYSFPIGHPIIRAVYVVG